MGCFQSDSLTGSHNPSLLLLNVYYGQTLFQSLKAPSEYVVFSVLPKFLLYNSKVNQLYVYILLFFSFQVVSNTFVTPMDCSLPGSSVHGISQVRILEWVAISFSRGSSQSRD